MLHNPDFDCPFVHQIDASDTALDAVLSQDHPDREHPIVYLSRKLHPPKRCYSTMEREALAVKWAVEALQYYLMNNPFVLVTDHAPLQRLHRVKDSNLRILRWYLALLPCSFQVRHQKGNEHVNADYLSRCLEGDEGASGCMCGGLPSAPKIGPKRWHHSRV